MVDDTLTRFPTLISQVADTVCSICGTDTKVNGDFNPYEIGFFRVGGNSANGYEVYHISCCER